MKIHEKRGAFASVALASVLIVSVLGCASQQLAPSRSSEMGQPVVDPVTVAAAVPASAKSPAGPVAVDAGKPVVADKAVEPAAKVAVPEKKPEAPKVVPSTAPADKGEATQKIDPADAAFVERNQQSITVATLDNGIPVFIKRNPSNLVYSIQVVLKGHTVFTPVEKAGLEGLTLNSIARGSSSYPYDKLQALEYSTSSSIGASVGAYDLTSFDLVTLDRYFDKLFDAWADCFLNPAFDQGQFTQVLHDYQIDYQKYMSDPYSRATAKLHAAEFAQGPYAADFHGTEASLASITLDDVRSYYTSMAVPERMTIVAVGNFDPAALVTRLNGRFGKMPRKGISVPNPPPFAPAKNVLLEEFPSSQGLAYIRGDFSIPAVTSPDSVALKLGLSMLNDLLFEFVRIQHGACYSVWAQSFDARSPYGTIGVYKTKVPGEVKKYVDQAVDALASGKCIAAGTRENGTLVPVAESLSFYKGKFISGFYSSQETNGSIAGQIATSDFLYGDYAAYLKMAERVDSVSAQDVVRAVNKYVKGAHIQWVVLGEKALLDGVDKTDYLK